MTIRAGQPFRRAAPTVADVIPRAHIRAPDGHIKRRRGRMADTAREGAYGYCGADTNEHTAAPAVALDPDRPLPDGFRWCTKCLAGAADDTGVAQQVADVVLAALAKTYPTT